MTAPPPVVAAGPAVATGGAALRVVVVNGSPNEPSRTTGCGEVVLETLAGMLPVEISRIDVYRLRSAVPTPACSKRFFDLVDQ